VNAIDDCPLQELDSARMTCQEAELLLLRSLRPIANLLHDSVFACGCCTSSEQEWYVKAPCPVYL
jgi:hypothetical protein